jgi:hypothetical protein
VIGFRESGDITVAAASGLIGAAVWAGLLLVSGAISAPADEDQRIREQRDSAMRELAALQESRRPLDAIRAFSAHIEAGRPVIRRCQGIARRSRNEPIGDEEFAVAMIAARDWLRVAMELVDGDCPGRTPEIRAVWRRVPSAVRDVTSPLDAVWPRRLDGAALVTDGQAVLRGCVQWLESRVH